MKSLIYTGLMILLWFANLFNGTGLDSVYHVTEWTRRIVILLFLITVFMDYARRHTLPIDRGKFFVYGGMIIVFIVSPLIHGYGSKGIDYLWVFCLVYLLSKLKIDDRTMFWTGLIYGVLGFSVLFIFDYGTALKGWNTNSIAMIGMQSFLVMIVPLFKKQRMINKVFMLIAAGIFSILISPTDSRSSVLFAFVGTLFAIGLVPRGIVSKNYFRTFICLMLPLIIAVIVIAVSNSTIMEGLNTWSYQQFSKPIFNGRDDLWKRGFELLWQNPFIGTGNLNAANWHNNAVACLVATGILGFAFWIMAFGRIMNRARSYLNDYIVVGCFVSFIVLYVQQSVELGFISDNPTLFGYILLGLMLGRVRFLEESECYGAYKNQHNCADIQCRSTHL